MVNAVGLLQISLSCMCWGTAKPMFDNACTCQGTVVDLFNGEYTIILRCRKNTLVWLSGFKKRKGKKKCRGGSVNSEVKHVSAEAGTSKNTTHSSADVVLLVPSTLSRS